MEGVIAINCFRHTSRLLFEYAAAPDDFAKNFHHTVERLYASNGNIYAEPSELETSSSPVEIHEELTVVNIF